MIKTMIGVTSFKRQEVLRLFHHANLAPVTGTGTDSAWVVFGNAETGRTKSHPCDNLPQTFGQGHGVFGGFQQMKGESQRGPLTDPR